MIRIFILVLILFFTSSTISISSEKDCSQYNKVTNWKGWKKCMKGEQKSVEKNKSGNFFSNIGDKYKSMREKAPKSGSEIWKKLPRNEN